MVQDIAKHEHPNAVCAICHKHGKLAQAAAIRQFGPFIRFYVCEGHAERARRWDAVCEAYAARKQRAA